MVRAGSWLTEFVSKESGVPIDSSEHETNARGISGLSQVSQDKEGAFCIMMVPSLRCRVDQPGSSPCGIKTWPALVRGSEVVHGYGQPTAVAVLSMVHDNCHHPGT